MFSILKKILAPFPGFKNTIRRFYFFISRKPDLASPSGGADDLHELKKVLYSGNWNMSYSSTNIHSKLEADFAKYIGTSHAVAVNTGGMALQMIFRAIGLSPGDEVIHQVDTCVATAFSVMNSFAVPVFADTDVNSFMLNEEDLKSKISSRTKIILPVHMWGNSENMKMIHNVAASRGLPIIEDACLSLGAEYDGKKIGSSGLASAFSFGCLKPLQAGEGGMIVTNDSSMAAELRILRNWGETTFANGTRDNRQLAWNGRMSEFVAAVAYAQLKKYDAQLEAIATNVEAFSVFLNSLNGIRLHVQGKPVYTQIVVKIDENIFPLIKKEFMTQLAGKGIFTWHANFEPINSLSFFKNETWRKWSSGNDKNNLALNYSGKFPGAEKIYLHSGLGFYRNHFTSRKNLEDLIHKIKTVMPKQ